MTGRYPIIRISEHFKAVRTGRELLKYEVEFYAHVVIKWGIQMGLWNKVEKVKFEEQLNLMFRTARDFAFVRDGISYQWVIWKPNGQRVMVGELPEQYYTLETDLVEPPNEIITRMRTGKYAYLHPTYK